MNNNIYEYGGIADVLIKCKTKTIIGDVEYKAHEPYTFLKDVSVNFDYGKSASDITVKRPIISIIDGAPHTIRIGSVPLTQKIANLMLTPAQQNYSRARRELIFCNNAGELCINYAAQRDVFVYDDSFNQIHVTEFTPNIIYGDFVQDVQYLVFYVEECVGNKYSLQTPSYPYFEIDIFMKGNTNKITNDVYMHFDAVSVISTPNLNINGGGILSAPLTFSIIYAHQEEPIIVFE